jgi:Mg2+/citrate symporter
LKTLADSIFFFLAMGLFVIGIYESMVTGISDSYWIFMISLSLLFLYGYRKNQHLEKDKSIEKAKRKSNKTVRSGKKK